MATEPSQDWQAEETQNVPPPATRPGAPEPAGEPTLLPPAEALGEMPTFHAAAPPGTRPAPPPAPTTDPKPTRSAVTIATHTPAQQPGLPVVPGYRVLGVLGRGGMGVVYRAWQVQAKRLVALKMVRSGVHAGPTELARFHTEAEAAARLHHPNIVQIYEVGEHDGLPYFSLEYIDGGTLADYLPQAPFAPTVAAELIETLARAVHHAHTQGVVHRDLKPGNILLAVPSSEFQVLSGEGTAPVPLRTHNLELTTLTPKVTDFGLAKLMEGGRDQTQSEAILGTPSYMAPEQAAGKTRDAGPPADIYALGAMLYELLTGRPPFKATTLADTLQQVVGEEPVPPRRLIGRLPRDLDTICLKCLQKEPEKRYATALELAEDLHRYRRNQPIEARPVGVVERIRKWARRHPAGAALVVVCVFGLLGALVGGWRTATREAELRRAAEDNFRQALRSVEEMLTEVGAVDLADVPEMAPVRERILRKAQAFFDDFLRQRGSDPAVRFEAARAHSRTGDILTLQGSHAEAEAAYRRALELLDQLPAEAAVRREQARARHQLGALLRKVNRFDDAEAAYRDALALRQARLDAEPDHAEAMQELAATRYLLGALLAPQAGRRAEAAEAYREALRLQEELAQRAPNEREHRRDAARTLNNLGRLQLSGDEAEQRQAAETFARAAALQRALVREARAVPRYRRELAWTLNNAAEALKQVKGYGGARDAFREALALQAALRREHPTVPDYRHDLATTHLGFGDLCTVVGAYDQAEPSLRAAVELGEGLAEELPDVPEYRATLAQALCDLGELLAATAREAEAEAHFRRAIALREALAAEHPKLPDYHSRLGEAREDLARLLHRRGGGEECGQQLAALLHSAMGTGWPVVAMRVAARSALEEGRQQLRRAVADQEAARGLAGVPRPRYRRLQAQHLLFLTETNLRLGDHAAAAVVADELARLAPDEPERGFQAARVLVRCAGLAGREGPGEAYSARAVQLLAEAIKQPGLRRAERERLLEWLRKEPAYDPLRPRPDYRELLREAENQAQIGVT